MALRRLILFTFVVALSCAYFNTFYNARKYFNEAESLYRVQGNNPTALKKYRKVIEKCSKVLDRYPKSKFVDDALYLMAISYMRLGEKQKSRRKFEELFTFFPQSAYKQRALLEYASLLISIGEYDSARSVISKLSAKDKRDVRLVLAKLAFKEGNYAAVIKMGREFLGRKRPDEKSREFLKLAADAALLADSLDAAQSFLSALGNLNLPPNERFKVNLLYLNFLLKRNKPDTALQIISNLKYPPESHENRLLSLYKARFLLIKGDTNKAKIILQDLLKSRRSDSIRTIAAYELARIFEEEDMLSTADSLYKTIMFSSYTPIAKKAQEREGVMENIIAIKDSTDCSSLSRMAELYLFDLGKIKPAEKRYRQVFKECRGLDRDRAFYALLYINLLRRDTVKAKEIVEEYPCDSISDSLKKMIEDVLNFDVRCQKSDTLK